MFLVVLFFKLIVCATSLAGCVVYMDSRREVGCGRFGFVVLADAECGHREVECPITSQDADLPVTLVP